MQTEKVMKAYELFDNAPRKRYEFRIDGLTPMIEYAKPADGVIVLTHTEVPRELAGRGIGSRLVEKALADIDRQGLRLIPRWPGTFGRIPGGNGSSRGSDGRSAHLPSYG